MAKLINQSKRKDIIINKFLQRTDNTLDIILHAYRLPLFVLAPQKMIDYFKIFSRHAETIIDYKPGDFENIDLIHLEAILKPVISDWKRVKQKELLNQIELATEKNKVAIGIKAVWHEAVAGGGRLLIVEKDFMKGVEHTSIDDLIDKAVSPFSKPNYATNQLDGVMEKVLENGGDVEFVDNGVLRDLQHIALIQHY